MQRLLEPHTFSTTDRGLRFLRLRLASRPATKSMIQDVITTRDDLRAAQEHWLEARESRIAQTTEVEYCDLVIDEAVMDISRAALVETKGDRKAPLFVLLFPSSPSKETAPIAGPAQGHFVKTLINTLRTVPEAAPLAHHADTLDAHLNTLNEAVAQRDALFATEATALAKRNAALADAKRFYNGFFPRLQVLLDNKALAETFFAKLRTTPAKKEDDDDEAAE